MDPSHCCVSKQDFTLLQVDDGLEWQTLEGTLPFLLLACIDAMSGPFLFDAIQRRVSYLVGEGCVRFMHLGERVWNMDQYLWSGVDHLVVAT